MDTSGAITVVDALFIAQLAVGSRTASASCPLADPANEVAIDRADTDGDGRAGILETLRLVQCQVGIANFVCPVE